MLERAKEKPFSQACENNKQPILDVLQSALSNCKKVLEIGSGTGQHAVFFAPHLPHLQWQPTDVEANLAGIQLWLNEHPAPNLLPLQCLDMRNNTWPVSDFDAVFSANTAHIMAWQLTAKMICEVGRRLPPQGVYALYGPFNYGGTYTSESNARFDNWLKSMNPQQGIRHFEDVNYIASQVGLILCDDNAMPANNRLLVWRKE